MDGVDYLELVTIQKRQELDDFHAGVVADVRQAVINHNRTYQSMRKDLQMKRLPAEFILDSLVSRGHNEDGLRAELKELKERKAEGDDDGEST